MTKLADHDLRKWVYSEHTRAKHEILERYLGAWLRILGAIHRGLTYARLIIFDGFAGRGRYRGGELGSPGLIHAAAGRAVERGIASKVVLLCDEANEQNFEELKRVMAEPERQHDGVDTAPWHLIFGSRTLPSQLQPSKECISPSGSHMFALSK